MNIQSHFDLYHLSILKKLEKHLISPQKKQDPRIHRRFQEEQSVFIQFLVQACTKFPGDASGIPLIDQFFCLFSAS